MHYDYDIAILGAGFAGSLLGAVLARNGANVLLIDSASHPRFSIGESTIPYTLVCLRTIAERYDVPEIKNICAFDAFNEKVARTSGIKKHFGFLIHREGEEPDPKEVNQFNTPFVLHDSSHYYRQDVDSYLFHVALKYGCTARQNHFITDVDVQEDCVVVHEKGGVEHQVRYVVDGTGYRSKLSSNMGLHEDPCRFKHHSRSMFTHMVGVEPTDEILGHPKRERPPLSWHSGTVHHMFDGGWFWIIPFNNHKLSLNPLVSVGLTIDPRRWPWDKSVDPEEEFRAFASKFPAVERQLRGARAVRPWVSTPRLQYSLRTSVGHRFCLLPHAYGFIDPLFSRGLNNTAESVNAMAWRLLRALEDGDFTAERFEYVDRLHHGLLRYNDELVNAAFISFRHYPLWNAVFKIWAWGSMYGTYRLQNAMTLHRRDHDDRYFKEMESARYLGQMLPDHDDFNTLFETMVSRCDQVEAGAVTSGAAADELFSMMSTADYIPHAMGFSDPAVRFIHPSLLNMLQTVWWALRSPPTQRAIFMRGFYEVTKAFLMGDRLF